MGLERQVGAPDWVLGFDDGLVRLGARLRGFGDLMGSNGEWVRAWIMGFREFLGIWIRASV